MNSSALSDAKAVAAALRAKLQESTLTVDDAKTLRFQGYTAEQVHTLLKDLPVARAGFRIPYFDLKGKPTRFYRFRYLEYHSSNGFGALATQNIKHPLRYAQPRDSINELYLPPFTDWRVHAKKVETPLIITEGELKAACATKGGYPTIGLGGVWCWKSARAGYPMLPQFEDFVWEGRIVYICFDSDAVSNSDVCAAENALCRALLNLAATPFICRIPALDPSKKTGLDDYIATRGIDAVKPDILDTATMYAAAEELFTLNEEVVYVNDPGIILKLANLQRITPRAFVDHAYSTRVYVENTVGLNGKAKQEVKSAPREWLKWPNRGTVERTTYRPGEPRTVDRELNVWPGWAVEPQKGTVAPWRSLMDYIFSGSAAQYKHWFQQWLAYPLQHPGEKLYSAVVAWGVQQGTGKSLVGYTMFRIYGRNATEINDKDLYSTHNEWAENKQFVMGDEITSNTQKRDTADRMKSMITQKQLRLNPKYIPSYIVPDCINYYFTSNHPDAFFLEDTDRRFFIHEVKGRPMPDAFYKEYMRWLDGQAGAAALFYYLLEEVDCSGFDPAGYAPMTDSKRDMIDTGRSDVAVWVARLREDPDSVLRVAGMPLAYRLWTTTELYNIYDPEEKKRITVNGLARELRRAGFLKVHGGQPVGTKTAGLQRLWVVRDRDSLLAVGKPAKLADIYDNERANRAEGTKY